MICARPWNCQQIGSLCHSMRLYLLSPINGDWKVYRATSFPSATLMQLLANVHYGCPIIIQRSKTSAVRRCHPLSRLLRTGWSTTLVIQELMDGSDGEDKWGMVDVIQLLTLVIGSHNLFISFPWCSFHSVVFILFRSVHFIPQCSYSAVFISFRGVHFIPSCSFHSIVSDHMYFPFVAITIRSCYLPAAKSFV